MSGASAAGLAILMGKALSEPTQSQHLAWPFFTLCGLFFIATLCSQVILIRITQKAAFRLRTELANKILHSPQRELERHGNQPLFTILTRDVDTFISGFEFFPTVLSNIFIILICLSYLSFLSFQLFFVLSSLLIVSIAAYQYVEKIPIKKINHCS